MAFGIDGANRLDNLLGNKKDTTRMLVIDTQRNQLPKKGRRPCVMSKDWRLVNKEELYHTASDPGQTKDVSTQYPEKVKVM